MDLIVSVPKFSYLLYCLATERKQSMDISRDTDKKAKQNSARNNAKCSKWF